MHEHLYLFSYETPLQRWNNYVHSYDDEDCYAFFVHAETKEAAMFWGQEVADAYLKILYDNQDVTLEDLGYSGFICEDPDDIQHYRGSAPSVRLKEYPALAGIVEKRYGMEQWWALRREEINKRPCIMREYLIRVTGASDLHMDPSPPNEAYINANLLGFRKTGGPTWQWVQKSGRTFYLSPEPSGLQVSFFNTSIEEEQKMLTYLQEGISVKTHIVEI
ncbi:hypothetical protein HY624_03100 [Candidatus Uhrbacteria bacterium]|nr:hypothetical protein [Candidatus Uhrbacteria bacterium]